MAGIQQDTSLDLVLPPEIPYPPAPWHANAQLWVGLFRAAGALTALPPGLAPLMGSRSRVIALIRYREGSTLIYDELLIGIPARIGPRLGVYVEYLFVDSPASLWGGRRIWGLPKQLATFTWRGDMCQIADSAGNPLIVLHVNRSERALPSLPAAVVGIGQLHGSWAFITAPMRARFGRPGLRIVEWSSRFPFRIEEKPRVAFAAKSAQITFPPPSFVPRL